MAQASDPAPPPGREPPPGEGASTSPGQGADATPGQAAGASPGHGAGASGEPGVGDVFSQFGQELTQALRAEIAQLRDELGTRAREAAKGTGFLAAAGVAGAVSGAAILSLPLILARRILPPGGTALLVAAGGGAAAAYLTKRGLDELAEAMPAETERLKEAARDAARRATGSV